MNLPDISPAPMRFLKQGFWGDNNIIRFEGNFRYLTDALQAAHQQGINISRFAIETSAQFQLPNGDWKTYSQTELQNEIEFVLNLKEVRKD